MPRIPQTQASGSIRAERGAVSPSAAGAVGQALGSVAQGFGAVGQAVQRKKEADDAAFVTKTTNSFLRQETERLDGIITRGEDVDMSSLQQSFKDRVSQLAENAPSQDARNELLEQADNAFTRKFFPAYSNHQSKLNVDRRVNSFKSGLDDIQSEVLTGRTGVAEAVARTEAALTGLELTHGGVVDIEEARINAFNQIAVNTISGRIDRGESGAVIDEIKGGKWDTLTDSITLGKLLDAAQKDLKQRKLAENKKFTEGLDDYVAFLGSGQDDPEMAARFSPENVNAVFGEKGAEVNEKISDARQFGLDLNQVKTASPEELRGIIDRSKPDSPGEFRREAKQFDILVSAINARNKAIADDPALYTVQNSPIAQKAFNNFAEAFQSGDPGVLLQAAKEYSAVSRAQQEELGVYPQGVQLLPKSFEDQIAKQLNDFSQGGEAVALQIDSLKQSFGSEWQTIQRQLQQNKKMGSGLRVMAGMDFGPEMVRLGEALAIPQKDYKEVIGEDNFKDIQTDVADELEDFQNTLRGQPGAEQAFIQHKKAIESLAMKYISDGLYDDTDDAIEQARADVLDSRFAFIDTYRVPVKFNPDKVEEGVSEAIDAIKTGSFDIFIPESSAVLNPEDRKEVYLSALRPVPITEPNGNGIMFTDQNGNAIRQTNGDPVIVPFEQLSNFAANFNETPTGP